MVADVQKREGELGRSAERAVDPCKLPMAAWRGRACLGSYDCPPPQRGRRYRSKLVYHNSTTSTYKTFCLICPEPASP